MPTYEYKCNDCEHRFEEFQSMSAAPITVCPECKGKTERIITGGTGFLFKGSGFYITENRSKDYQASAEKEKSSLDSGGTKPDTTNSDKKPESKSESKSEPKVEPKVSKPEPKASKE